MITKDSKTVLIADDSTFFRTKLSDVLTEAGHGVRLAGDGRGVVREISSGARIDLLILDLQMPDLDGFGVLKWLSDNGYQGKIPVLAVTGVYESSAVIDSLKSYGAAGLMTKGATPEQIIFRVNRVLFPEKSAKGSPNERVPVSIPADFTVNDATSTGFLLNLSDNGVFLHTKRELKVGSSIALKFSLPGSGKVLDMEGVIRWSTAEAAKKILFGGYGISFSSISDEDHALIRDFVEVEKRKLGINGAVT